MHCYTICQSCHCLVYTLAVEVNFKESSYRVNESAGMVKVSLVITGQFFKNVSATVECVEGNATGGFCSQDLCICTENNIK